MQRTASIIGFTAGMVAFVGIARGDTVDEAAWALRHGRVQRALEILPQETTDPEQRLQRALALVEMGGFPHEALRLLHGLERDKVTRHLGDLILYLRAQAQLAAGQGKQAGQTYRRAARWPGSRWVDRANLRRAAAPLAEEKPYLAVWRYRALLKAQPEHPRKLQLRLAMARAEELAGNPVDAAEILQDLWLSHPSAPEANLAGDELARMALDGTRLPTPRWPLELERAKGLRRAKLLERAESELFKLRQRVQRSRSMVAEIDRELVRVYMKGSKAAEALTLLRRLLEQATSPGQRQKLRWLEAECMGDVGQADEAAAMLLAGAMDRKGKLLRKRRQDASWAFRILVRFGRHEAALKLLDGPLAKEPIKALRRSRGYLAFRAGKYDRAIKELAGWIKLGGTRRAMAIYWQARAHQRAGRGGEAITLYKDVLENHLRSYYGILARSRLIEAGVDGVLEPGGGQCWPDPNAEGPPEPDLVPGLLAALTEEHGKRLPELARARSLWRLGLRDEARRELVVATLAYGFAANGGKEPHWFPRPEVERVHMGGPPPRRRWNRDTRALYKVKAELRPALARVLDQAGVFYYGWKLQRGRRTIRQTYPRAFSELVLTSARDHRLDPNLLWAVMRTESTFRPDAVSRVGATGLMQIMPSTGRRLAAAMELDGFYHQQLFSPELNLRLSGWYMRAVQDKFKEQLPLVAAAYNGGPHNVARWLRRRGAGTDLDEFVEEMPFTESRRYAKKILLRVALYERVHCGKDDRLQSNKLATTYLTFPNF